MPLTNDADITLFYAPRSRAVMGLWLLEEIDRPYRIELLSLDKGEQKSAAVLKHNPMGKVPVILDGEVAVSETGAIITYLLDKYSPGVLAPLPLQPERGRYLKWLFFAPESSSRASARSSSNGRSRRDPSVGVATRI